MSRSNETADRPANPLIQERPTDTLNTCVCALAYLRTRRAGVLIDPHNSSDPLPAEIDLGRSILFEVIEQALVYESGRTAARSAPGDAS